MHKIAFILLVIGGINLLLLGLFSWDIGDIFGGQGAIISRIVYILIGVSAVYELAMHKKHCKACGKSKMSQPTV